MDSQNQNPATPPTPNDGFPLLLRDKELSARAEKQIEVQLKACWPNARRVLIRCQWLRTSDPHIRAAYVEGWVVLLDGEAPGLVLEHGWVERQTLGPDGQPTKREVIDPTYQHLNVEAAYFGGYELDVPVIVARKPKSLPAVRGLGGGGFYHKPYKAAYEKAWAYHKQIWIDGDQPDDPEN